MNINLSPLVSDTPFGGVQGSLSANPGKPHGIALLPLISFVFFLNNFVDKS
ncbi:MAG: hypothetical protein KME25_32790 [Symplocastrum torsivum CPER-KK1]|uniref:Uncharacterized protein n=1 Tax=Symplocastrum torsivum CPER-KK1 TaxID=450513 RepID=A0A951UDP7_9CYAN|nr:hypothetical protein [Symplocastrum torsivum CPER-KK1]